LSGVKKYILNPAFSKPRLELRGERCGSAAQESRILRVLRATF
jgi:hypothetical protein